MTAFWIEIVINYDVPSDGEDYVHRGGRTARAATTGIALTLVNEEDQIKLKRIEDLIGDEIKKLPVPVQFGETPPYNPSERKGRGRKPNKFRHKKR